ncbi:MAG: hypothetical protein WA210_10255 [Burkholderiaceae bacterium]
MGLARLDSKVSIPFSQQPLLKAALLPLATMGGTTLLDYMTLANI